MKSLIIIKPGFLQHEEGIVKLLEKAARVKLSNRKEMTLSPELLAKHYEEHIEKPFYPELVEYMTSGPVVVYIAEGKCKNTISRIRTITGATRNPDKGTIREIYGIGEVTRNVLHSSDSEQSAAREIAIFYEDAKENAR